MRKRSQTQARKHAAERARKRKRKEMALKVAEVYKALGTTDWAEASEELERRELRRQLEAEQG